MLRLFLTLPFLLAACLKDETISGYVDQNATFALMEMNGLPFDGRATVSFPEHGVVAGNAPCNSYSAEQSAPLPWFKLGPIRSTRMACPDLQMESAFFAALSRMTLIEALGNVVILRNDDGEEMVFRSDQA